MRPEVEAVLAEDESGALSQPIETCLARVASEADLPDFAVAVCALRAEEAAPALLAVLARAAEGAALDEDEARLVFRGLHILGGAREPRAFAPLLRLLRRSPEEVDDLLGDAVTETLPRIAVGAFDGDADALFAAIAGGVPDEYAREALLRAATFLAWEGRIDRARMQGFLARFFEARLAAEGEIAWMGWIEAIALLGLRPLAPLVRRAFDEGLVADEMMRPGDFDGDLADAERAPDDIARFERRGMGYIEDIVAALDWTRGAVPPPGRAAPGERIDPLFAGPASNPWRDVGRNDPCPCGSGRKAKKCCLAA